MKKKRAKTIFVRVKTDKNAKFKLKMTDYVKYAETYDGRFGKIVSVRQVKA